MFDQLTTLPSVQIKKIKSNSSIFLVILGLLFISLSPKSWALSEDVTQPVNLEADAVIFNRQAGTAIYSGNVQIQQGTLLINADRIDITAPNNEIQIIKSVGSPVRFQQQMDNGKLAVGSANIIQYFVLQKRLILEGNATLNQDKDSFASNQIEYMINTGELKAGRAAGDQQSTGRVRAIFHPTNQAQ